MRYPPSYTETTNFRQEIYCKAILQPSEVAWCLGVVAVALSIVNVLALLMAYMSDGGYARLARRLFDLDGEANIPSFFSGCLFLINAALLLLVWQAGRAISKARMIWFFLAGLFVFLAFDELFRVHERLIAPVRAALNPTGFLAYGWHLVYGMGVVLLSIMFFPAWWRLSKRVKLLLGWSAATFLSGAIGVDMMQAAYDEAVAGNRDLLVFGLLTTIEESFEMAGLIMLVYGLLSLLQIEFNGFAIVIPSESERFPGRAALAQTADKHSD